MAPTCSLGYAYRTNYLFAHPPTIRVQNTHTEWLYEMLVSWLVRSYCHPTLTHSYVGPQIDATWLDKTFEHPTLKQYGLHLVCTEISIFVNYVKVIIYPCWFSVALFMKSEWIGIFQQKVLFSFFFWKSSSLLSTVPRVLKTAAKMDQYFTAKSSFCDIVWAFCTNNQAAGKKKCRR